MTRNAPGAKRLLSIALVLGLALTIVWMLRAGRNVVPGVRSTGSVLCWPIGAVAAYDLAVEMEAHGRGDAALSGGSVENREISGTLILRVLRRDADEITVGARLVPPTTNSAAFNPGLASAFHVVFAASGEVSRCRFADGLELETRGRLDELMRVFEFRFPQPASRETSTWVGEATDSFGRCRVRYTVAGNKVHKQKLEYFASAHGDLAATVTVADSRGTAEICEDFWLQHVRVEERLEVAVDKLLDMRFVVRARLDRRGEIPPDLLSALAALDSPLSADSQNGKIEGAAGDGTAQTLTAQRQLSDAMSQLLLTEGLSVDAYLSAKKLLAAHPEFVAEVERVLNESAAPDRVRSLCLLLLERAGHDAAQAALERLATAADVEHVQRVRAIIALGGVDNLNDQSFAALWRIFNGRGEADGVEFGNTAALALGGAAGRLRSVDDGRYPAVRGDLVAALHRAGSIGEVGILLKSLGNTGDPAVLDEITPHLRSDTPSVRAAAAKAIGSLPNSQSLSALTQALSRETDDRVRHDIAESLVRLDMADETSVQVVKDTLGKESSSAVTALLAEYLVANLDAQPQARPVLEAVLASTTSTRVREVISAGLARSKQRISRH
ncbi:MAG: HEAT repeat domain-containing protein [Planctomycetota bacterium]